MREIKLNTIFMDGRDWPVYCDLNVLEEIQENFASVSEFDRQVAGWDIARNEKGEPQYYTAQESEELAGRLKVRKIAPKIRALKFGLYVMIKEGLIIAAEQGGPVPEEPDEITPDYIARICDIGYDELAGIISEQMRRCFSSKKKEEKPAKRNAKKST